MKTEWIYDGYVKVKVGEGRKAHYVESFDWKCAKCGRVVRTHDRHKPQFWCADCREDGDV